MDFNSVDSVRNSLIMYKFLYVYLHTYRVKIPRVSSVARVMSSCEINGSKGAIELDVRDESRMRSSLCHRVSCGDFREVE